MKYLYLISMFLSFNLKNLSAYQEITIQKDSNLQNYQELLLRINDSITEEDIISSIEKNIYNINFSNTQISLNVDIDNLSKDLYAKNIRETFPQLGNRYIQNNSNVTECSYPTQKQSKNKLKKGPQNKTPHNCINSNGS